MRKIRRRKRVIKKKNKYRNHRLKGYTESKRPHFYLPRNINPYQVIAPLDFSIDNINGLVKFVHSTEQYCIKNKVTSLKVELCNVVKIDMYGICLMLSMLNKLSCRKIRYWGTYPDDLNCKQYIIDSGFLDIMRTTIKKSEDRKNGNQILMIGKEHVDSNRIGKCVKESMKQIVGVPTVYSPIYDNICEISANSVEHANQNTPEKNWLVSISREKNQLHFILTDTGLGILKTLKKKVSEKIIDFASKNEAEVLKDVFLKLYQSITGEINRHKGLPVIYQSFEDGFISNLQVMTNKVMIDFEKNITVSLRKSFNGVLYSWTVSIDNYNKWIKSWSII